MSIFYLGAAAAYGASQARGATQTAAAAKQTARNVSTRQEFLECEVNRLAMISQALWELLKQHHPELTEEDLTNKVMEIDLSDGKLDGRVKKTVRHCESCGRALNPRHMKCIYCGNVAMKVF